MFEALEGLVDVPRHGEATRAFVIIPLKGNGGVEGRIHIDSKIIILFEGVLEEGDIGLIGVGDEEIINDEAEHEVASCVAEEARGARTLMDVNLGEALDESSVGYFASLFETIHTSIDFNVDVTISGDEIVEVVVVHDGRWHKVC